MSDNQPMPEFPNVSGARFINEDDRRRISEAAWKQANGSVRAFEQLCAEHARGEIDLFSDTPTAIRIRGSSPAPGSDRFTATGGETASEAGSAPAAQQTSPSGARAAAAPSPLASGSASAEAEAEAGAAGSTIGSAGSVTSAGTDGV